MSGVISIPGAVLAAQLDADEDTKKRFWKHIAAELVYLIPEKFKVLHIFSVEWVR